MTKLIDSIDIDCPYCRKKITISRDKISGTVKCRYCRKTFETVDDGLSDAIDEAENMIDDFIDNLF